MKANTISEYKHFFSHEETYFHERKRPRTLKMLKETQTEIWYSGSHRKHVELLLSRRERPKIPYYTLPYTKKQSEMYSGNHSKTAKSLLSYLKESNDFPDKELAESIEKARSEFRKEFKLES